MHAVGTSPFGKAVAVAIQSPFAVPSAFHTDRTECFTDTVYMGAWPRSVLEQVGGFDERLGVNEDYELNYRIRRAGGKVYLTSAMRSQYFGRQTPPALWKQYFRYGRAKVIVLKLAPRSLRPRQLVAPAFVGFLLSSPVWVALGAWTQIAWLSVVLAYLLLSVAISLRVAARAKVGLGWLPVAFAIIHLSWGLGFWAEVLAGHRPLQRAPRSSSITTTNAQQASARQS
jgi:GT2 family glycosyltransferase